MFAYGMFFGKNKQELYREIEIKKCTINILKAMVEGKNEAFCDINSSEIKKTPFKVTKVNNNCYKFVW